MSRKVKSYCLDFEPEEKSSSTFSFTNIKDQVIRYVKLAIELLIAYGITTFCLYYFYTTTNERRLDQLTYVTFVVTCLNALLDTPIFRHESFCELKSLMDYAQEVLPLPFLTADLWMKYEIAPAYVSYLHAGFGLFAVVYVIFFEYKRQDLSDLTMILNFASLMGAAISQLNYFAMCAAVIAAVFYVAFKRTEDCFEQNKFVFMCSCAFFNLFALFSFDPDAWMPIGGGEGGAAGDE